MPKADAYIISHKNSDGSLEYLVRPSCAVVDGSNGHPKFRIRNLTGDPNAWVDLKGKALGINRRQVKAGKHDAEDFALVTADLCIDYEVTVGGQRAKGDSDPVIIIDPPTP
jgi:hypothetical protein